jgi:hypothetical protein
MATILECINSATHKEHMRWQTRSPTRMKGNCQHKQYQLNWLPVVSKQDDRDYSAPHLRHDSQAFFSSSLLHLLDCGS